MEADSGAVQETYFVILLKDFTVLVFDASDNDASTELFSHCQRINEMYGWCQLNDVALVKDLANKLRTLDKSQPRPLV